MSKIFFLKTLKEDKFLHTSIILDYVNSSTIRLTYELGELRIIEEDMYPFFALTKIRAELEKSGLVILCKGARRDVYPSGMSAIGIKAYELEFDKQATKLVDIFDEEMNIEKISSIAEQKFYRDNWLKSLNNTSK